MAEADKASASNPGDDDQALRRRLLVRVAVAGVLVVVLLGGLALFDSLYVRSEKEEPPTRVAAAGSLTPAEPREADRAIEEKPAEPPEAAPEAAKPDAGTAEPEVSSAPSVAAAKPERRLTVPAQARPAMMRPSEPVAAVQKPPSEPPPARTATATGPATASRAITAAIESAQRFLIQMGVFSNPGNAEELRAKLELAGLPTQIETRVQVGPFASRHEADLAREKLKLLGMEPGVMVAVKRQEKP